MANYGTQDVKCPFYKGEDEKTIKCEGVISDSCTQPFKNGKKKEAHKEIYCDCYNFKNCPYHKILSKKYN